jgi:hypothetical protein
MHKFDPSQHYGQIYGTVARLYEQNGILFDEAGNPCEILENGSVRKLEVQKEAAPMAAGTAADDYRNMSVDRLKQVCSIYGIDYQNRQQAIAELEGR